MASGTSYNGWPANTDPNAIGINQNWTVNGIKFPNGIKSGDVEKVFTELVKDLIKIEAPVSYDYSVSGMWGWEYRANANNPNSLSCHSSGTCIDYNAVKHVNGGAPYNGWSSDAISKVKNLLSTKYQNKISWLADQPTPDPMHFEAHTDAAGMKALAATLDGGSGEDDMPLSQDDIDKIVKAVWAYNAPSHGKPVDGKEKPVTISTGQTIADAATYASRAAAK